MKPQQTSSFGDLLKLFRQRKKLSQQVLANKIEVHRNSISLWERNMERPETFSTLLHLATVLDLDEEEKRLLIETRFGTVSFLTSSNLPFDRNPYFTGRERLLQHLHLHLGSHGYLAITQAIVGLGGIGKTQLALEYAYRYQETYHDIFWINADTSETIISSFIEVARLLRLPERNETYEQKIVDAVKRWLSVHEGWLLVFDNLEDLSVVKQFVPIDKHGAVLLTTRRQVTEPVAQVIEVDVLAEDDGTLFLLKRSKRIELHASLDDALAAEVALARILARQLGGLPLALDQAGAYILETSCTLEVYLHLWQQRQSAMLARRGSIPTEHPTSVTMTFTLAFEWVHQRNQAAVDLLKLCAFLAPDALPEELFVQRDNTALSLLRDPLIFNDAIGVLRSLSLVRRHPDTHTLSLHRLVQTVLRQAMSEADRQQYQQQTIHLLFTLFPMVTFETWPLCDRLLPHVLTCTMDMHDPLPDLELADILAKAALYLHERAQYEQALPLFMRALRIREHRLGSEHFQVARVLNNVAELYRLQGKYEQAQPLCTRALHIWEQSVESEPLEVANTLNKLAAISYEQGRYDQARLLYERALHLRERELGAEHPEVARVLCNLAILHRHLGKYDQAQSLYERALLIWERVLGSDHPTVAYALNGLAILFTAQGKYDQAQSLYERTLSIWERAMGPDHPEVGHVANNLADLYREQGKYDQARLLYERALRIWEQAWGSEHFEVAGALSNLAELYSLQGAYEQAQPLYERALLIWEQAVGPDHPHLAYALNGLADIFVERDQYKEAEQLYARALHILEQGLGCEHPETAQILHDLALCTQQQGLLLQAAPLFRRALKIRTQSLGDSHPKTVASRTQYEYVVQAIAHEEQGT